MNRQALYNLSYGLFVLSVRDGEKHNGCITNAFMQVTDEPCKAVLAINKQNLTHDMLIKTGKCNLSVLNTQTPFAVFEQFGFKSGRETDKFSEIDYAREAENGLKYIEKYANSLICCEVEKTCDFGTHTLFAVKINDAKILSDTPSCTYSYYQSEIKPKSNKKSGWQCTVCGYIYEGEELPEDFICPLCKHPASDFARL